MSENGVLFYKQVLFSCVVLVFLDLVMCFLSLIYWKSGENRSHLYQEPLLDGGESAIGQCRESKRGGETITPLATSNVFSLFTFSWIKPLIALGYKKPLDLEDVPQLDGVNNAKGVFSVLRIKLESDKTKDSQITTFSLVKAVILTTWKDIIITALLALVYTLASYVGPFLIDSFVKYLNGHLDLNEGFLLVSRKKQRFQHLTNRVSVTLKFFVQVGIRVRASLVAMIYHKGLTLSSQSKQGHSNGEIINFMAVDAERI
nr:ABC transporter C family member 3-like [Tanacetum cinerariifolium]